MTFFYQNRGFFLYVLVLFLIVPHLSCGGGASHETQNEEEEEEEEEEGESGEDLHERLYVGTGEYSPNDDWDAILRFEAAENLNSDTDGVITPNATIPVKETLSSDGIKLNFAHGLYLVENRDEMYVASIFTNEDNSSDSSLGNPSADTGSIGIIANISLADGAQTLSRHLFGDETQIIQPHGVWVDESREILYIANTYANDTSGNILAFDNAFTVDGNVPPDRVITHSQMGSPVFTYVDEDTDRMFVASANGPNGPSILIFNDASTLSGDTQPAIRIVGDNTSLGNGNNLTTHNVWFESATNMLIVAHHTNEVLFYDISSVDFDSGTPTDYDIAPRILKINEVSDDSDAGNWSAYGLFYLPGKDRLYVSAGYGENAGSGPPSESPPSEIKIYDSVSTDDFEGMETPTRVIQWSNGLTYYPPQPLWIQEYEE